MLMIKILDSLKYAKDKNLLMIMIIKILNTYQNLIL